jgi:hypothetical protein
MPVGRSGVPHRSLFAAAIESTAGNRVERTRVPRRPARRCPFVTKGGAKRSLLADEGNE